MREGGEVAVAAKQESVCCIQSMGCQLNSDVLTFYTIHL